LRKVKRSRQRQHVRALVSLFGMETGPGQPRLPGLTVDTDSECRAILVGYTAQCSTTAQRGHSDADFMHRHASALCTDTPRPLRLPLSKRSETLALMARAVALQNVSVARRNGNGQLGYRFANCAPLLQGGVAPTGTDPSLDKMPPLMACAFKHMRIRDTQLASNPSLEQGGSATCDLPYCTS
jgi:hypothetical protein